MNPLRSVDLATGAETRPQYERSDFCPVPRAGVILEAMTAFVVADALIEKLGGDSLAEMKPRFDQLRQARLEDLLMDNVKWRFGRVRRVGLSMEPNLILTGFMGTGKTTVGQLIAQRLGREFIDTDRWIEEHTGKTVAAIFAEDGEESFRAWEAEACEKLSEPYGLVIPVHRLEIVGTNGTLRWDNAEGILHFHRMPASFGSFSDQPPAPVIESFSPPEGFERNQLFLAQTRHFIEIVRGESEPVCSLEDGIMALRLALAAYQSQQTGQRVTL